MKRTIALVFVIALLVPAVFAATAGANNGKGPGNGRCTSGSLMSPGLSLGANEKCVLS